MKRGLAVLNGVFPDSMATVDKANPDAGRIGKLCATIARNGDNTADRPLWRSHIISVPDRLDPVSLELLKKPVHSMSHGCDFNDGISSGNKGVYEYCEIAGLAGCA